MQRIVLSVKRGRFRRDDPDAESADMDFKANRPRVLARDQHTCVFCDFTADNWQDVHHRDDNHTHNDIDNLVTCCKICHACHHIWLASQNNGGVLIYLPEIEQTLLNRLVRAMFVVGKVGSAERRAEVKELWDFLYSRRNHACEMIGTHSAATLANALMTTSQDDYNNRESRLCAIRFLIAPSSPMLTLPNHGNIVDYWANNVYNRLPESSWESLSNQLFEAV